MRARYRIRFRARARCSGARISSHQFRRSEKRLRPACNSDSASDRSRKRWQSYSAAWTCFEVGGLTVKQLKRERQDSLADSQTREKIVEKFVVNRAAFGMILNGQSKGIITQPHLLDHL